MQVWLFVMRTMKTIIKKKQIQEFARKVSTVIVWMIFVHAIVLKVIGTNNSPCCILMWNEKEQQKALPVYKQHSELYHIHQCQLKSKLPEPLWLFVIHSFCKAHFAFDDITTHDKEEKKLVQNIPFESGFGGAHHILFALRKFMMTEIMPRYKCACGMTIRER